MNRKALVVIVVVLLALNFVIGGHIYSKTNKEDLKNFELFVTAIKMVRKHYVDEEKVDTRDLVYGALKGMLQELDPHSQFMDPDVYKEMQIDTTGEFGGLGIEITKRDGFVTIITPIEGTPAARVGLLPGDRIVRINGKILRSPDLNDVVKKLRGVPGTSVKITVVRGIKLKDFEITRDIIKVPSVVDAKILEDNIGYVRLVQFQEKSARDLLDRIHELEDQGMEAMILDLRNNPGGLLKAAFQVGEIFIPEGNVIVSTKGRSAFQSMKYTSKPSSEHKDFPLVVLINRGSASASEIVAGAIKDLKRGLIVGEKSYGKGSVQTILPIHGHKNTALRLTTAKYFTPSGVSIHEIGIKPDIEVILTIEEEEARLRAKYQVMEDILENNGKDEKEPKETPGDGARTIEEDRDILDLTRGDDEKPGPKYDRQLQKAIDAIKVWDFLIEQRKESEKALSSAE